MGRNGSVKKQHHGREKPCVSHPVPALTAGFALGVQQDCLHWCLSKHISSSFPDNGNDVEGNFPSPSFGVPRAMEKVVHQDAVHGEAGLRRDHA